MDGDVRRVMGMRSTSTDNPLGALDPHVAGPLEELVQALDGVGLDPGLLELCATRIEQMIGGERPLLLLKMTEKALCWRSLSNTCWTPTG